MDFIGPLPKSHGFNMLLIITDRLTGYIKAEPTLQTITAKEVEELFHRTWYRQFGLAKTIVSDRDKLFSNHVWRELHRLLLEMKIQLSTSYHPKTDGSRERANKTIIESIRHVRLFLVFAGNFIVFGNFLGRGPFSGNNYGKLANYWGQ